MRALREDAGQLHDISNALLDKDGSHAYLSTVAPPLNGQLCQCTVRAKERAGRQTRLVPMHKRTLEKGCSGRCWQGRGRRQIRTISSSTWRGRVRGIVGGTDACALLLGAVAVWLRRRPAASASARVRPAATASARVHGQGVIVVLLANAGGFLVGGLPCRGCSTSMCIHGRTEMAGTCICIHGRTEVASHACAFVA